MLLQLLRENVRSAVPAGPKVRGVAFTTEAPAPPSRFPARPPPGPVQSSPGSGTTPVSQTACKKAGKGGALVGTAASARDSEGRGPDPRPEAGG